MHIEFGDITRGEGKIFQYVSADVPEGCRLSAVASSEKGEAPCVISSYGLKAGTYVLILVALSCTQKVEIAVINRDGVVVAAASEEVAHIRAALTSKFNTFSKREGIELIRNIDWRAIPDEAFIQNTLAIMDYEKDVRTTYFTVDVLTTNCAKSEFDFIVMGKNGDAVSVDNIAVLRDSISTDASPNDARIRHIEISCDMAHDLNDYIVWIKFKDGITPNGLMRFLPERVSAIKSECDAMMVGRSGVGGNYQDWFLTKHKTSSQMLELQKGAEFEIEPLFSIVVPLYKTPLLFFKEMLESVLGQTYGNFELLLVNASPEDIELKKAVRDACLADVRVREVELEANLGITLNTNEGIKAARGDFLCFFDHDDILEPDILFEYVKGINRYPETDLLYCDEDKLVDGVFVDASLKPDFDWDLILACNYVCHLLTVRKSVVDGFDELPGKQYDGSQDHNMTLRVAEKARNIYHARKVLYHWRVHPGSTAGGSDAKPWTQESGRIAVQEHLDRCGIVAKVSDHKTMGNFYNVDYAIPAESPLVSIVIPNKDHIDYLGRCLESIYSKSTYDNFEVLIVENNSVEDATFAFYEAAKLKYPGLTVVVFEGDFNFSAICNLGSRSAKGECYLFLNNDTEVIAGDWLERMVGHLLQPRVGCVGAKLLYPNDAIQHIGIILPKSGPVHIDELRPADANTYFGFLRFPRNVSAVTGACLGVRAELFDLIGGFDEGLPVAYNDVDFCLRVREKGYLNVIDPRAVLYHYESVSRGYDERNPEQLVRLAKERAVLTMRYPKYFAVGDPYYNCNFAQGTDHYELS